MDTAGPLICPVIVGRDDLLELAGRRLAEVGTGRGQLLFVAGEAGIGKTRLIGALERRATGSGFGLVRGGTYPSDLQVPAAILVDLARAMSRSDRFRESGIALAAHLDSPEDQTGDAHRRRRLLTLDVAEMLVDLGRDGPCLVVLEDLHWSDDLTLEILEATARRLRDVPVFLVGTYRSDELYPRVPIREWRARLLAQRLAEEIRLERLTPEHTATMVNLITAASTPISSDVANAIHTRTDGIPLYVEELLGVLAAAGLDAADAVRSAEVPDTVEATLVARVEQRSPEATTIARAGAVIGRAFDIDMLAAVMDEPPETLSAPLRELADHFILLPTRTPGRLGFRHALICDAIYDRIPEPDRRRLHARAAEAATERPEVGTDAFLSLHYERAGRRAEAFAGALRGARAATAMSSHGEARELYQRAMRTAPADLADDARAELLEGYAGSLAATDDNQAASVAYEAARESYRKAGRTLEAAAVVAPLVSVRHLLGDDLTTRVARLRDALRELGTPPPLHQAPTGGPAQRVMARLLAGLSAAFMLDRRLEESIDYGREALRLATAIGDQPTERHAAVTLGACYVFAGRMEEGWSLLEAGVAKSLEHHLESEAARAYRMLASCASVLVEYPRAEVWLRDGIAYAERVELWNHRHYMAAHLGHVLWATGRWDEADRASAGALADGRGGVTTRITALHVQGYVALSRGSWSRAGDALGTARDLGTRMRELQRLSPALWGLAEVAWLTGETERGLELVREGFEASAVVRDAAYLFPFLLTGTRLHLANDDPGAAARWLDDAGGLIAARGIPGTLAALDHARALLQLAEGGTGQARAGLEQVVDAWVALGRVWEGTWARVDLARCHLRSNQRDQAARVVQVAATEAQRLGSPPLLGAVREIQDTLARRGHTDEPWSPLTAREFEVARLVTTGLTNGQVAEELGLSPKTISAHLEHIMAKLGVGRRAEVAAWVTSTRVLHSRPHGDDREE